MSTGDEDEDWMCDFIVAFLRSPPWTVPLWSFIDVHCLVFDADEENKFVYTDIHKEFVDLVDALLTDNLKDMGGGNLTRVVRGESIAYLEVRRTSANGTLKVIVMEDQDTLFETDNLDTAKPIIFKK